MKDKPYLITTSDDRTVKVWDYVSGVAEFLEFYLFDQ